MGYFVQNQTIKNRLLRSVKHYWQGSKSGNNLGLSDVR